MAEYKGLNISPLHKFTKSDWFDYAGAEKIGNSEPLIGDTDFATVIISGNEDDPRLVDFEVDFGDSEMIYVGAGIKLQTALKVAKEILDQDSIDDAVSILDDKYPFVKELY